MWMPRGCWPREHRSCSTGSCVDCNVKTSVYWFSNVTAKWGLELYMWIGNEEALGVDFDRRRLAPLTFAPYLYSCVSLGGPSVSRPMAAGNLLHFLQFSKVVCMPPSSRTQVCANRGSYTHTNSENLELLFIK